jgi:hypothetical protein
MQQPESPAWTFPCSRTMLYAPISLFSGRRELMNSRGRSTSAVLMFRLVSSLLTCFLFAVSICPERALFSHPLSWIWVTPSLQNAYVTQHPYLTYLNSEKHVFPKCRYPTTRLYGVIFQKTTVWAIRIISSPWWEAALRITNRLESCHITVFRTTCLCNPTGFHALRISNLNIEALCASEINPQVYTLEHRRTQSGHSYMWKPQNLKR